jgi:hypothetical protein
MSGQHWNSTTLFLRNQPRPFCRISDMIVVMTFWVFCDKIRRYLQPVLCSSMRPERHAYELESTQCKSRNHHSLNLGLSVLFQDGSFIHIIQAFSVPISILPTAFITQAPTHKQSKSNLSQSAVLHPLWLANIFFYLSKLPPPSPPKQGYQRETYSSSKSSH